MELVVIRTAHSNLFYAAQWLAKHGFTLELSVQMGDTSTLTAQPSVRVVGVVLPDELTVKEGDVICAGLDDRGMVRAVCVMPEMLAGPMLEHADTVLPQ